MSKFPIAILLLIASSFQAAAQQADTTSAAGAGMPDGMNIRNMAMVATSQHYPLPYDVLEYKKQLGLTANQIIKLNAIIKTLNMKKAEVRQSATINEKMLQKLFAARKAQEGSLIFYGNRYGLYEGEMRTAVLVACAATGQALTPLQLNKFEQLQKHSDN